MNRVALTNIGTLISGDINESILKYDAILIEDGKIKELGFTKEYNKDHNQLIDVGGMTVAPGLIDSHCHPVFGDYAPKQDAFNYIDNTLHGGVTTIISAGEIHIPGKPNDPKSSKALAYFTHKAYRNYRPSGVKLHGGALLLESGLCEEDFKELAREGVWLVAEVGLGSATMEEAKQMVIWAKENGMKVPMHTGGISIGKSIIGAKQVLEINPDIVSHINGGFTSMSPADIEEIIKQGTMTYEISYAGNPKMMDFTIQQAQTYNVLDRVIIGSDVPTRIGIAPTAILRTITQISALSGLAPERSIALATGNTGRAYNLDTGTIASGKSADLIVMDTTDGSVGHDALTSMVAGDLPAIALVMIDGEIMVTNSRSTFKPIRKIKF